MRDVIPAPVPGLDLRREYGHHQSPAIRAGGLIKGRNIPVDGLEQPHAPLDRRPY